MKSELSRREFLKLSGYLLTGTLASKYLGVQHSSEVKAQAELENFEYPWAYPILSIDTDEPYVCLSFDDGNEAEHLEQFLEITRNLEQTFTVFPTGESLELFPDLWQEICNDGHEIGNHTYNHPFFTEDSTDGQIDWQFRRFEQAYEDIFNKEMPEGKLARVPYAQGILLNVQESLTRLGYLHVHWRRDSYSWDTDRWARSGHNPEFFTNNVGQTQQGEIILNHFNDIDIPRMTNYLQALEANGLQSVTFSELLNNRRSNVTE